MKESSQVERDGERSGPLVSVVVATYNMGKYLPAAIDSILAQTYRNFEIVVVDDGSTDDTSAVIAPYVHGSRFTYTAQSNLGQPKAKNAGVRLSRGELIAFCDADDVWLPKKLELQVECFLDHPHVAVVSSEIREIDDTGREVGSRDVPRYSGRILDKLLIKNCISFGTAVIRKDVFDVVGGFDDSLPMGIDWDLWLRVAVNHEFLHLDEVTYLYRVWPGQMSQNYRGRYENAFRILDKFFTTNPEVVSGSLRRRAYADTYFERGRIVFVREGAFLEAFKDHISALRLSPLYLPAWKSLLKLLLGRR